MEWWKKKKARAYDKKVKLIEDREMGAKLLEEVIECCDGKSNPIKFFSPDQILEATDNFSNATNHVLPPDLYDCKWYSGKNEKHPMLLIKRSSIFYSCGREERFCRDIAISSMVSGHKNFFKLAGCCLDSEVLVMVYHGVKKHYKLDLRRQPWIRRMKIAEDIATALAYLHTAFPRPFVYRTMNLDKFVLDEDGVAKLWDFSCCVSIPEGETFVEVRLMGTLDYMDPSYVMRNIVSEKTDVYAFGVVMLKLLTGERRPYKLFEEEEEETEFLVDWAYNLDEEPRMDAVADPMMLQEMGGISKQEICQMRAFLKLSKRCLRYPGEIPTMTEVAKELKMIQRSLIIASSSSPSGETQLHSAQGISFPLLSNQTSNT